MVYLYSLGHFCKCLAPLETQPKGKASEGFFFLCSGVWVDGGDIYLLQFIKCIIDKHAKGGLLGRGGRLTETFKERDDLLKVEKFTSPQKIGGRRAGEDVVVPEKETQ